MYASLMLYVSVYLIFNKLCCR